MLDDSWLRFGDITIFKWWLITMLNFQKFTVKITCAVSGYNTLAILHWSTGCCSPPPQILAPHPYCSMGKKFATSPAIVTVLTCIAHKPVS